MAGNIQLGMKAPPLQVSEWFGPKAELGGLIGQVVLIEVFQVNCPGCFLYALPQAVELFNNYGEQGLSVLGVATAFEDFDKNNSANLSFLMDEQRVIGETLRVLTENKLLSNGRLPYRIPFPVAMDRIVETQAPPSEQDITDFIHRHYPDFEKQDEHKKHKIRHQTENFLHGRRLKPATFNEYGLQGTPSQIVIDRHGMIRAIEFGYFPDIEWLLSSLLQEKSESTY